MRIIFNFIIYRKKSLIEKISILLYYQEIAKVPYKKRKDCDENTR